MSELAEECKMNKNKSLKRLFTKWLSVFYDQIEDNREYFKLAWTTSFSRIMVALRIFSTKPDGIYPCMSHIASYLVGNIVYICNQDLSGSTDDFQGKLMHCKSIYPDLLNNRNLTQSDYRFLLHATNVSYASRRDSLGLGEIISSTDLVKLCIGDKIEGTPRFLFESEDQYYKMKKSALDKTLDYIDEKLFKYPFEAEDHPANVGTDTENESETDYTPFKAKAIHKDKVKETMSILLMTCFEVTMQCPFSTAFQDSGDLYCCMLPEHKCDSKIYRTMDDLRSHTWGQHDVYHTVLDKYLDCLLYPYNSSIGYPNIWLPEGKLENCKVPFPSKENYYDIKSMSAHKTIMFCRSLKTSYPFGQLKKYKNWIMTKQQTELVMNCLFKHGFEATLRCPLSKSYMEQNLHQVHRTRLFPKCYECECEEFQLISDLTRHCSELDCQYHQLLHKYFETFESLMEPCSSSQSGSSSTPQLNINSCTNK